MKERVFKSSDLFSSGYTAHALSLLNPDFRFELYSWTFEAAFASIFMRVRKR
jgi:hypothetical protein